MAKDLPDKTEMIAGARWGRTEKFTTAIKNIIARVSRNILKLSGMAKVVFSSGWLTKLRQICDSPALLADQEDYSSSSAKMDELMREIEENAGEHKVLVFSQFTGMLETGT